MNVLFWEFIQKIIVKSHINLLFNSITYGLDGNIIDPGDVWDGFENVYKVLLTHAHFDHIYGLNELLTVYPGHPYEQPLTAKYTTTTTAS